VVRLVEQDPLGKQKDIQSLPGKKNHPPSGRGLFIQVKGKAMSRNIFMMAALATILLLATACSSPRSVTLTGANNGGKVEVQDGGQIIIRLDGNPSTGFTWETKDLDATLFNQAGDPVFSSSSPGLVGSGGTLTLTFTALKTGTSQLTLVYHRPWETGVDPINRFTVTVTVK